MDAVPGVVSPYAPTFANLLSAFANLLSAFANLLSAFANLLSHRRRLRSDGTGQGSSARWRLRGEKTFSTPTVAERSDATMSKPPLSLKHFTMQLEGRKLYRQVLRAIKGLDADTAARTRSAQEQFDSHAGETDVEAGEFTSSMGNTALIK